MADITIIRPGPLEQIALGLRERLMLVFPDRKFSYAWMPARVDADVWRTLTRRTPFIGIGFNRFGRAQTTTNLSVPTEWTIYLATKNEAGQEALLFGDRMAPGLFSLVQVAASALHGFNLKPHGTVQVAEGSHAFVEGHRDDTVAVGTVELAIGADMGVAAVLSGPDAQPADLKTQVIRWAFGDDDVFTDNINTETP